MAATGGEEPTDIESTDQHTTNNNNNNIVLKGKRTKRLRPQSPIPFVINDNNSSSSTTNADDYDEDEDMANCLILLAQCQSKDHEKFNSRKFIDSDVKTGYYVYECKTCNRTFPSFQALGGHRASHKKPKPTGVVVNNLIGSVSDEDESNHRGGVVVKQSKVHECSICGAEFTSGQALGGHMRRHRAPVVAAAGCSINTNTNTTLSLSSSVVEDKKLKSRNAVSLDLDLNLPAPEDDFRESKQQQQQQKKQSGSGLVFSAPTLVDCHY